MLPSFPYIYFELASFEYVPWPWAIYSQELTGSRSIDLLRVGQLNQTSWEHLAFSGSSICQHGTLMNRGIIVDAVYDSVTPRECAVLDSRITRD